MGATVSRTMSGRVKRPVFCLQMLNRTKNTKLRKAILEYADADIISALCECAHNGCYSRIRDNASQNGTREGKSVGVALKDNKVER